MGITFRNSFLASIFGVFGGVIAFVCGSGIFSGELDVLQGLLGVAAGVGLIWIGSQISKKKAEKKAAEARRKAEEEQNTNL